MNLIFVTVLLLLDRILANDVNGERKNITYHNLQRILARLNAICLKLPEHPALEESCFENWMIAYNLRTEVNISISKYELARIEERRGVIEDNLEHIETRIKPNRHIEILCPGWY